MFARLVILIAFLGSSVWAIAAPGYAVNFNEQVLYQFDPQTGQATNPIPLFVLDQPGLQTYVQSLSYAPDGTLWATLFNPFDFRSRRVGHINVTTGAVTMLPFDLDIPPGSLPSDNYGSFVQSLAIDPVSGDFFVWYDTKVSSPGSALLRINHETYEITPLARHDWSVYDLAFDRNGSLWGLPATPTIRNELWKLDPWTGAILETHLLTVSFPDSTLVPYGPFFRFIGGVGLEPGIGDSLLVVTGNNQPLKGYWSLDPSTAVISYLQTSNLPRGVTSAAIVPESRWLGTIIGLLLLSLGLRAAKRPGDTGVWPVCS